MASVRAVNRAREHARAAARAREAARQAQRAEQARQAREREQRARMRDLERREEQEHKDQERQARPRQQLQKQREERTGLLASKEQSPEDNDAQWGSGLWGANDDQATENAAQKDAKTSKNDPAGYGDTTSVNAVNKAFRERQQKGIKAQLEAMKQKRKDEAKRARDRFVESRKSESLETLSGGSLMDDLNNITVKTIDPATNPENNQWNSPQAKTMSSEEAKQVANEIGNIVGLEALGATLKGLSPKYSGPAGWALDQLGDWFIDVSDTQRQKLGYKR